jgi:hypothetical protein
VARTLPIRPPGRWRIRYAAVAPALRAPAFVSLDLRGRVGVFSVARRDRFGQADTSDVQLRVVHLSRRGASRQCVIYPHGVNLTSPVITRRFVYWIDNYEPGPPSILRRRLPTRDCVQRGPVQLLRRSQGRSFLNVAVTGGHVFYTRRPPGSFRQSLVQMTDPLVRDP